MKRLKILLERHRYTEEYGTSLNRLFTALDEALTEQHDVVRLDPMTRYFSRQAIRELATRFTDCDVAILFNPELIATLRNGGWEGRLVVMALGALPRGAVMLRTLLPHLRELDTILLSCQADADIWRWMIKHGPPVKVVHFGVNTEEFRPMDPESIRDLRRGLGYGTENRIILYAGRITLEKNVHGILPIFAELVRAHPNYRLLIVGPFQDRPFHEFRNLTNVEESFQQCLRDVDVPPHTVRLIPHVDTLQLVKFYNISDLFVNLTLHHDENFGYSQVEAMACGVPVVATAWGGLKDTIQSGTTGYLVPTWTTACGIRFDRIAAKEYIHALLEDDRSRHEFGATAAAWVRDHFCLSRFTEQLLTLLRDDNRSLETESLRFSPEGLRFNVRFSEKKFEGGRLQFVPQYPVYEEYRDKDYCALISPYTSGTLKQLFATSKLFTAGHWDELVEIEPGGWKFRNRDPLWPFEVELDDLESSILRDVAACQLCSVEELTEKHGSKAMQTLHVMVEKGFIGIR